MEKVFAGALAIVTIFGLYCVFVSLMQWIWNEAVVGAFSSAPTLTFWQTFGCMMVVGFVGSCFRAVGKSK